MAATRGVHLVQHREEDTMSQIGLPKVPEIVLKGSPQTTQQHEQTEHSQCQLTPREMEILHLLAEGKLNKEIAALLGISVRTVETHRARIMLKLGLHSLAELIHYALRHGIVSVGG